MFKALADPVRLLRLRLLSMIASRAGGEGCVGDPTPAFGLSQPTISHCPKLLREAGLIASERRGTWVYYRLLPETADRLAGILTRSGGTPILPTIGAGCGPADTAGAVETPAGGRA